jgi:hypothetical protein
MMYCVSTLAAEPSTLAAEPRKGSQVSGPAAAKAVGETHKWEGLE